MSVMPNHIFVRLIRTANHIVITVELIGMDPQK